MGEKNPIEREELIKNLMPWIGGYAALLYD
jgi:hypothetical protein